MFHISQRIQPDQKLYCSDNGMLLVSLESQAEEQAVTTAWGTGEYTNKTGQIPFSQ